MAIAEQKNYATMMFCCINICCRLHLSLFVVHSIIDIVVDFNTYTFLIQALSTAT